jgi:hypothetical protein
MHVGVKDLARRAGWRACALVATIGGVLALLLSAGAAPASAASAPSATDVMFIFDTSGSMGSVLEEAKTEVQEVMSQISGELPNVAFGVSEVKDTGEEFDGLYAWKLDSPITTNTNAVKEAINPLEAFGGGDGPEAYGRALWESDTNPEVGWRPGAKHLIILVADEVPHMKDVNEGIPAEFQLSEGPGAFCSPEDCVWPDTGEEFEGTAEIKDTQYKPGVTHVQFLEDLNQLVKDEKPLEMVDIHDTEGDFVHYWEHWAGITGGKAVEAVEGGHDLASRVSTVVEEGVFGTLPSCPTGERRNASSLCVPLNPSTTQVICNLEVASASDTCTATVADAATTEASNPTGTVSFASSSGGAFPSANSCTLADTPLSGNTSSCSVTYLPPTSASSAPAITASYGGDSIHAGSSGTTSYPPASELAKDVSLEDIGTIHLSDVEIPITCEFDCLIDGSLYTGPSLASIASVGSVTLEVATTAGHKHKKSKKPKLLGSGTLKLSKAGKGKLIVKISNKYRHALDSISGKVHLTLKVTIKTPKGTVVENETLHVTLSPKKTHKRHH